MARKSSHNSSAPGPKKKISAQTRVKLSQAAKKRRRGLKGTSLGGKFIAGAGRAATGGTPRAGGKTSGGTRKKNMGTGGTVRERAALARESARGMSKDQLVESHALNRVRRETGRDDISISEISDAPVRVSHRAVREVEIMNRTQNWDKPGVFQGVDPDKSVTRFMREDLSPEHRKLIENMANDPSSPLARGLAPNRDYKGPGRFSPAIRRRMEMYTQELRKGRSHAEALSIVEMAKQGPGPSTPRKPFTGLETRDKAPAGRRKREYDAAETRNQMFKFGLKGNLGVRAPETPGQIGQRYPDMSEESLIRASEAQKQSLFNQTYGTWAHETKRAALLGSMQGGFPNPERVVVLATNIKGTPPVTVPTDSLMGQYVIKRRKRFMRQAGVPGNSLRGEFPEAVRDQHLVEWATTGSYGVAGEHGFNIRKGWRKGNRLHGLDKPRAFGSQIIYGSDGRPMYDEKGNIRYTQGTRRSFNYETPGVGLRVFIG